jgi:hypothetical protein
VASKRWSTRIFGEYTFLEDSRYASQAKNARGKNSHTVATVNGSELGKSAPSAVHPTPRRERRGDPVTATGMSGDFAPCANAAASGRWSMRSFGEYAFLEDSRYASQAENAGSASVWIFPARDGVSEESQSK